MSQLSVFEVLFLLTSQVEKLLKWAFGSTMVLMKLGKRNLSENIFVHCTDVRVLKRPYGETMLGLGIVRCGKRVTEAYTRFENVNHAPQHPSRRLMFFKKKAAESPFR